MARLTPSGLSLVGAPPASGDADTDTERIGNLLSSSGHFVIPSGNYILNQRLSYLSNTWIEGMPGATFTVDPSRPVNQRLLLRPASSTVSNVSIRGLTFNQQGASFGLDSNSPALSIQGVQDGDVIDCHFSDVLTMAVWCDDSTGATNSIRISGNRIRSSLAGGISLFGAFTDIAISDNLIFDVSDDAIAIQATSGNQPLDVTISGNVIKRANLRNSSSSTPRGILVFGGTNVSVSGNTVDRTVGAGIKVQTGAGIHASNVSVNGNTITRAGVTAASTTGVPGHGIYVQTSDGVIVANNVVSSSRESGIAIESCTASAISGNVSRLNGAAGVRVELSSACTISDNITTDNGATSEPYGILLISSTDLGGGGNVSGETRSGGSRTQTYGLAAISTVTGTINSNRYFNNVTAATVGTIS